MISINAIRDVEGSRKAKKWRPHSDPAVTAVACVPAAGRGRAAVCGAAVPGRVETDGAHPLPAVRQESAGRRRLLRHPHPQLHPGVSVPVRHHPGRTASLRDGSLQGGRCLRATILSRGIRTIPIRSVLRLVSLCRIDWFRQQVFNALLLWLRIQFKLDRSEYEQCCRLLVEYLAHNYQTSPTTRVASSHTSAGSVRHHHQQQQYADLMELLLFYCLAPLQRLSEARSVVISSKLLPDCKKEAFLKQLCMIENNSRQLMSMKRTPTPPPLPVVEQRDAQVASNLVDTPAMLSAPVPQTALARTGSSLVGLGILSQLSPEGCWRRMQVVVSRLWGLPSRDTYVFLVGLVFLWKMVRLVGRSSWAHWLWSLFVRTLHLSFARGG